MVLGKNVAIFDWEWGRNWALRDGQKRPCITPFRASVRREYAVYYVQKSAAYAEITHQRRTADF